MNEPSKNGLGWDDRLAMIFGLLGAAGVAHFCIGDGADYIVVLGLLGAYNCAMLLIVEWRIGSPR